jgi:L-seryl-tRNA(Ser) seleniumtransferase
MKNDADRNGSSHEDLYPLLPSISDLLLTAEFAPLLQSNSHHFVVKATRSVLKDLREEIARGEHTQASLNDRLAGLASAVAHRTHARRQFSLRRVINATGVILHTNLGRAPLSRQALQHLVEIAAGYCNLEFDLESGERGSRDIHVESLLLELLGQKTAIEHFGETHRAIVVNNCAAATFLALRALAQGKEVIVSRGELVEIGGGFRIPEILRESGALLREVGTTNRTRVKDYESALTSNTGLILRVHQSNFSMEGFVERPTLAELVACGKRMGIPVFEDQGTGLVEALAPHPGGHEATLTSSFANGCDLVAASGDKLLGAPQCGILVGKKALVETIRRHPLFRIFRVDKLMYAALEATLVEYLSDSSESIPVVRMLRLPADAVQIRCEQIIRQLNSPELKAEVVPVESLIGGGTAPKAKLPSFAIALRHTNLGADDLLRSLRQSETPIVARIAEGRVILDLRTVEPEADNLLTAALNQRFSPPPKPVEEADV